MSFRVSNLEVPLRADEGGVLRVGTTRVSLDSVLASYLAGSSAEQIAEDFSTLELADIHAVMSCRNVV